jgi:hydrogenase expression/formation protein HypE
VNDLAMVGARPRYISMGFILEEGFPVKDLKRIVRSARDAADEAGVLISTGDTKVVERGNADGIYINTSGIGVLETSPLSSTDAKPGDDIIVNGPLGCHGMAIITSREGYGFENRIVSDVAPLNHLALRAVEAGGVHVMRDATRGGVATVLNEIASRSGVHIELDETALPIQDDVRGACELLGFDPLYVANEGIMVIFASAESSQAILNTLMENPYGRGAAKIGRVTGQPEDRRGRVTMKTTIGSHRILDMLSGEQLPRIC